MELASLLLLGSRNFLPPGLFFRCSKECGTTQIFHGEGFKEVNVVEDSSWSIFKCWNSMALFLEFLIQYDGLRYLNHDFLLCKEWSTSSMSATCIAVFSSLPTPASLKISSLWLMVDPVKPGDKIPTVKHMNKWMIESNVQTYQLADWQSQC